MRGHFGHLHFKTFPMTLRALKCKEISPLQLRSEFLRVPEDSNFPLLGVWASPSHLAQSGVATRSLTRNTRGVEGRAGAAGLGLGRVTSFIHLLEPASTQPQSG